MMAPEMWRLKGYDRAIDWWALGILLYTMLIGASPFRVGNLNIDGEAYKKRVMKQKVKFPDRKKYKLECSDELIDLITRLLDKNEKTRIGASDKDYLEIKNHPLFKNINWDAIIK